MIEEEIKISQATEMMEQLRVDNHHLISVIPDIVQRLADMDKPMIAKRLRSDVDYSPLFSLLPSSVYGNQRSGNDPGGSHA